MECAAGQLAHPCRLPKVIGGRPRLRPEPRLRLCHHAPVTSPAPSPSAAPPGPRRRNPATSKGRTRDPRARSRVLADVFPVAHGESGASRAERRRLPHARAHDRRGTACPAEEFARALTFVHERSAFSPDGRAGAADAGMPRPRTSIRATRAHDGDDASKRQAGRTHPFARETAFSHPACNSATRSRDIAGSNARSMCRFAAIWSLLSQ